jgi:predicted AAA+ superfamily ATPase
LVLHELPAWRKSIKRKPLSSSKYYFFDVGVAAALQGRLFRSDAPEFGQALETIVFHELLAHRDYLSGEPLAYWRSTSGFEVDFVIGDHTAIEVKATQNVSSQDLRSLLALAEERKFQSLPMRESRAETAQGWGGIDRFLPRILERVVGGPIL